MKNILFLLFLLFSITTFAQHDTNRTLVHIFDYLASDYAGAVSNGKITNQFEYNEQVELVNSAVSILKTHHELQQNKQINDEIMTLQKMILQKKSPEDVATLSQKIKNAIINISRMEISPTEWPNLKKGQEIFEKQCVTCHGIKGRGDGPSAAGLNPKPTNFQSPDLLATLSPFKAFNTARVGVEGTAMTAFPSISDKDLWDVSFYVTSLRHSWISENDAEKFFDKVSKIISLEKAATLSDTEIATLLEPTHQDKEKKIGVASIRLHSSKVDSQGKLSIATFLLNDALSAYKAKEYDLAKTKALAAYLEGIEPVEPKIKAHDSKMLMEIEKAMGTVRSDIERKLSVETVEKDVATAQEIIQKVNELISQQVVSPGFAFFMALTILLREGFEAVLVVIALLGVIRATKATTAAKWVHGGWISAVLLGIVLWIFSGYLLNVSGASRELTEGAVSLFAVVILLYMGFWLHSVTEIKKWNAFIKVRVEKALGAGSLLGLAVISFTAVAREALETVLFLRTIWLESGAHGEMKTAMFFGVITAFVIVLGLAAALLKYSAKLPVRSLFAYSSAIMAVLSFIMVGKAFHSIQEAGKVSITDIPFNLRIDLLGIYPTAETLGAQLIVLILIIVLWHQGKSPKKNA